MDLQTELKNIEKYLFPKMDCDPWERAMYYHLLAYTRISNREQHLFGIIALESTTKMSRYKVRETIRSMDQKGCIQIVERNRNGHMIKVLFPSEIEGLVVESEEAITALDIEGLDFYKRRQYLESLLERDSNRCIYCLKKVTAEKCVLDHIKAQAIGGDNFYRNIAISCHECNSRKGEVEAIDFIRSLYRNDILTEQEFHERKEYIEKVTTGIIKPCL